MNKQQIKHRRPVAHRHAQVGIAPSGDGAVVQLTTTRPLGRLQQALISFSMGFYQARPDWLVREYGCSCTVRPEQAGALAAMMRAIAEMGGHD